MSDVLAKPVRHFRSSPSRGSVELRVEEDGGDYGAGIIRNVSVITRGEALGHDGWVDRQFVSDVASAINATETGIKARFTHPGLSADGLGTQVGKLKSARFAQDQTFADLHIIPSAHNTPDGNLAEYVSQLATDAPEDFGLSIVFDTDLDAQAAFVREHTFNGRFVSPDENNKNNLDHFRLASLRAGDVVDEPAANPGGMFYRGQEIAADAEHILDYALGLTDARPELQSLSADPDRIAGFVQRYLTRHGLSLRKAGDPVSDTPKKEAEAVETQPTREQLAAEFRQELKRFTDAFGAENGAQWFDEGISYADAQGRYIEKLNQQIAARDAKIDELQETLSSINRGDDEGHDFSTGDNKPARKKTLADRIRINGRTRGEND